MRLPSDNGHRPPPQHLLHERLDIRQIGLVVERRTAVVTDHPIQLLPRPGQRLRKRAAGQHERDQRGTRRVAPGAEQVSRQRRDLLRRQVVLRRLVEQLPGIALWLLGVVGCLFGQGVEEAAAAAARAEAMFPGGDLVWEFGEDCTR